MTHRHRRSGGSVSVQFTEEMKGYVSFGEADCAAGAEAGRESRTGLMFHLTIVIDPVDRFVRERRHQATATGYVRCEELGDRLPVEKGIFNLFVEEGDAGLRRMLYRLYFRDAVGHPLTLTGFKLVRRTHLPPLDVWPDTTTLYTRILRGHVEDVDSADVEVVASGVLRIRAFDFARQLSSFRTQGPSRRERSRGLSRFVGLFLGELWGVYMRRRRAASRA